MNKQQMREKFFENIEYLQRNIPPDDIYVFAEETFMAALFFLYKWSKLENIQEQCENDLVSRKWVNNILSLQRAREERLDVTLDLGVESVDDE